MCLRECCGQLRAAAELALLVPAAALNAFKDNKPRAHNMITNTAPESSPCFARFAAGAVDTVATVGSWHVQPNAVNSGAS